MVSDEEISLKGIELWIKDALEKVMLEPRTERKPKYLS